MKDNPESDNPESDNPESDGAYTDMETETGATTHADDVGTDVEGEYTDSDTPNGPNPQDADEDVNPSDG